MRKPTQPGTITCHLSKVSQGVAEEGLFKTEMIWFQRVCALTRTTSCCFPHYPMVMSTDTLWTNKSKWVISEDVTLGRFCSYSSDVAIIQNTATAERNDLRALYLQLKIPSEPPPRTWDIFNRDKGLSFAHQFDFLATEIRKSHSKET